MDKYIEIKNSIPIPLKSIPEMDYNDFLSTNTLLAASENNHCVALFGDKKTDHMLLFCCMANDATHTIYVNSTRVLLSEQYPSLSRVHFSFHIFEREIHESFGLQYTDHPWLKPVRYPWYRHDQTKSIENYPFYHIQSEELHEVGVGPVHAGIIEPGHFRFICNGEQILHLEIQLGYQHRGIEKLIVEKDNLLTQTLLSESIAGDTVVGHTVSFSRTIESLSGFEAPEHLEMARTLALEWERMAIHSGDLSAIATDVAYQLGSSVFGRLRTPIVNSFQVWCGNRLAKGLIRPYKNRFPFNKKLASEFNKVLDEYWPDYTEMFDRMIDLPSVLSRLEKTGIVTRDQHLAIGSVGMAARSGGLSRDIRQSHPHDGYHLLKHQPVLLTQGDVYARTLLRDNEIRQSAGYIRQLISLMPEADSIPAPPTSLLPDSFVVTLTEGWRGEIAHAAITNKNGKLALYKIKDPSMHNWMALALAVRNNEISDFPICNKSFNLSYCGFDL